MSEDKSKHMDPYRQICLEHEWELRNWMNWLHCSEQDLRTAVESIGADPDNVRRFLRQSR